MAQKVKVDYFKYTGFFFIILLVCVPFAFFKTYFSIFPNFIAFVKDPTIIHFHAAVTFLWVVLLVMQPMLIRHKKYKTHRLFGKMTYVLAPLIVISFIALIFNQYFISDMKEKGFFYLVPLGEDIDMYIWYGVSFFYFQIMHIIFFTTFYVLAVFYKKDTILHSSYMIATGLIFINPIFRRVGVNFLEVTFVSIETIILIVTELLILGLLYYSIKNKLKYKQFIFIFCMFLTYHIPMFLEMYVLFPGQE